MQVCCVSYETQDFYCSTNPYKCTRRQAVPGDTVIRTERIFFKFIMQGRL